MSLQISKHFSIKELIDPETYGQIGDRSEGIIDPRLIETIEAIREKFGRTTINTWEFGGRFEYSGYRPCSYKKGAKYSSHRFGNTADLKFPDVAPIVVQQHIIANPDDFPYVIRMEDAEVTKTWLHVETGRRRRPIKVFKP